MPRPELLEFRGRIPHQPPKRSPGGLPTQPTQSTEPTIRLTPLGGEPYHQTELGCPSRQGISMASFGESLRREREMRGVSLEEISATTKINVRFLQALEAEDFAKLPGGLFRRSFLRAYAGYLGLDTERILVEYQLVAPPPVEGISNFNKISLPPARRGFLARFVPLLIAASLLATGYMLYRYSHRTPEIAASVAVTAPVSSPPAPAAQSAAASPSSATTTGA